jgi:hypothetical protein
MIVGKSTNFAEYRFFRIRTTALRGSVISIIPLTLLGYL